MKSLQEFLTEARWNGAGGERKYKITPVIAKVWGKAEESKFETTLTQIFKTVPGAKDITDAYSYEGWRVENVDGKSALSKTWRPTNITGEFEEHIRKVMKDNFGIDEKIQNDFLVRVESKYLKSLDVKIPNKLHVAVYYNRSEVNVLVYFFLDDIKDIWETFNPTYTINFQKPGTPGGINDAVGRTLQEGDIVAFMRRAGTGGMEIGTVININKRPVIWTEEETQVSLDGSQICLVKRGNNIVM